MPDFERMYLRLFNAVTDALAELADNNAGRAADVLRRAQEDGEEAYMDGEAPEGRVS